MQLVELKPDDPNVQDLFAEIDRLMNTLYPIASDQSLALEELNQPNVRAVGLKDESEIVACGAIVKQFDKKLYGEIKRLYVKPSFRGKGLSKRIMQILLHYAGDAQIPLIRLETGLKQEESIKLYESLGFERCERFGLYRDNPLSVFMSLSLQSD
ncbi:GNAT family N-acetyltransferase [Pseudoalteromonas luteoviolacea]|uniref:Acetyltransferase n=1 Tax=Pseudoalteromonas luteoviolacea S4054 TaxID=1129367 RepID=A0A0F6A9R0_9GAMM|nr:GNAT family N-acetyltransferase [Pseudoalteromonas luteoviolacea]AOT10823.1 acetyltransferase [Pseudoalteromonas luteoviolacea]AOT16015.1 acetyltransferase [Pseudoalteromonas luteoviolacea]AOT20644.1 acetyltransferase [Pseudoalteromonas luteoviolacea]KKE82868.1 acetyltransferase [Pseudoalteromonas luteoviolacea S4054]KZN75251.1 acetyltransferase [Pseudoalteromonas luteoviolacea S4047-1]